jgi:predicted NUDIX family phosphoesterase
MEFVYVIKREILDLPEQGIFKIEKNIIEKIENNGFFVNRSHAENDPDFKQIIPYILIFKGEDIFVFKRLKGGGEKRLHNLFSIGVGGHINPVEIENGLRKIIHKGALRELSEEVNLTSIQNEFKYYCLLNDDTNSVGKVHLGVVMGLELEENENLKINEIDSLSGEFVNLKDLFNRNRQDNFETWSEIIINSGVINDK